jgi:hypothetical protein
MKFNFKLAQLSLCTLFLSCLSTPIKAQASVQPSIEVTPSSLTLIATRCLWGSCSQNYVLSIRANSAISQIQVIPLVLTRSNGQSISTALRPQSRPNVSVAANEVVSIPLEFDPNRLASGEYKGDFLITYQGGSQKVPVVVQVKDYWLTPLLILLTGVAFGIMVSAYREQGQPRDQLILRIGQLRSQMLGDPELAKAIAFQEWIQDHLIDVETALQRRQFATGDMAIAEAEMIWVKWRKGRTDWLKLMDYQEQLRLQLTQWGSDGAFKQTAIRQLNDVIQNMPLLTAPDVLRDQLEAIAKQVHQYAQVIPKMMKLNALMPSLSEVSSPLKLKIQELQKQIEQTLLINLKEADLPTRLTFALNRMTEMEKEIDDAIAALPPAPAQRGMEKVGRGSEIFAMPFAIAPAARPLTLERQIQKAGIRLRLFIWTSYAIAVTFLAGAGFVELYANKPTFGAEPWRDYFALLAWGFGAEATRDAVTKTVRNWQLPGIKENV